MRLWHQKLIPLLPRQQLLGQHRECCALRGKGWGKKHATVDYVFTHEPTYLIAYHMLVMDEMRRRGYNPSKEWYEPCYRGKEIGYQKNCVDEMEVLYYHGWSDNNPSIMIYSEHNDAYLQECIENLKGKGIDISV